MRGGSSDSVGPWSPPRPGSRTSWPPARHGGRLPVRRMALASSMRFVSRRAAVSAGLAGGGLWPVGPRTLVLGSESPTTRRPPVATQHLVERTRVGVFGAKRSGLAQAGRRSTRRSHAPVEASLSGWLVSPTPRRRGSQRIALIAGSERERPVVSSCRTGSVFRRRPGSNRRPTRRAHR